MEALFDAAWWFMAGFLACMAIVGTGTILVGRRIANEEADERCTPS